MPRSVRQPDRLGVELLKPTFRKGAGRGEATQDRQEICLLALHDQRGLLRHLLCFALIARPLVESVLGKDIGGQQPNRDKRRRKQADQVGSGRQTQKFHLVDWR